MQLRKEREGEARARLLAEKERLEQESRQTLVRGMACVLADDQMAAHQCRGCAGEGLAGDFLRERCSSWLALGIRLRGLVPTCFNARPWAKQRESAKRPTRHRGPAHRTTPHHLRIPAGGQAVRNALWCGHCGHHRGCGAGESRALGHMEWGVSRCKLFRLAATVL